MTQDHLDALAAVQDELVANLAFSDGDLDRLQRLLLDGADDRAIVIAARLGGLRATFGVARVLAALRGCARDEHEDVLVVSAGDVRCVAGTLRVERRLDVIGNLIVLGDLEVAHVIRDCGPDSRVAVVGSIRALGVHTDGDFYVGGDLTAEVVYAHYNDNSLLVGGTLRARLVVGDDHDIRAARVESPHFFDLNRAWRREVAELLVEELFDPDPDGDEYSPPMLDRFRLFDHLARGKAVFRS